jgi:hypothetical protein
MQAADHVSRFLDAAVRPGGSPAPSRICPTSSAASTARGPAGISC